MHSGLPNRRTDPSKHTGMKNMPRRINAQTWISAQGCKSVVIETNVKTHGDVKTVLRFDGEKKPTIHNYLNN